MQWPFTKNTNRYALVGNRKRSLLAAKTPSPTGVTAATPLGWADSSLKEAKSIHQLMANISNPKGEVAISLPLEQFEILSLSINKVPREVVAKILPFHVSKVLDEPLSDFIHDWQIVKEHKDSLQINVFLYPAKAFSDLRTILGHYKLTPSSLEPDVFSACAYLESRTKLPSDEATMIVLLWPHSISIAIYDKESLILNRNVQAKKPEVGREEDLEEMPSDEISEQELTIPEMETEPEKESPSLYESNHDDLLANFLIETKADEVASAPGKEEPSLDSQIFFKEPQASMSDVQSSPSYINQISLELMRTRDYFNSVVKGNQIRTVFVGGGEGLWPALSAELESSLGLNIESLVDPERASMDDALFEAVSIGALS
ncbi:MAG: hypothetical protein ABFS09_02330 [Thermodesulfobacteriota bacterium]